MTNLSVNINKIATLRNARGENMPDVAAVAVDCQRFGADGITVHPRPDERHIRQADVWALRPLVHEFNIEGYPSEDFLRLVIGAKPEQVTLVPDSPDALTSSAPMWRQSDSPHRQGPTASNFTRSPMPTLINATAKPPSHLTPKPPVRHTRQASE